MTVHRWAARLVVAVLTAVGLLTWLSLPPRSVALDDSGWRRDEPATVVRGVYHVHTRRSDGTGTVDDVAAAAGRVGLDFLILTDHGDATRTPDPPRYLGGVLVIDAVEISTRGGHYVAIGLPGPSPYRLAGSPGDVIEDVRRMGGFGIVAHPDSPKKSLAWKDWSLPVAAFEWLNADTEWRDEAARVLGRTLLTYPFRPTESITALFHRPERTLDRWDRLTKEGHYLVGLAGADAHARLGLRDYEDDGSPGAALPVPGYEWVFRGFSTLVELERAFDGPPVDDARRLIDAMQRGRTYTGIAGFARPTRFEFFARTRQGILRMGDTLPLGEKATFVARGIAPPGTRWRLVRNGAVVAESSGLELVHEARAELAADERGAGFRVEAVVPDGGAGARAPWIVSNPIFLERRMPAPETVDASAGAADAVADDRAGRTGIDLRACTIEKDATSSSATEVDDAGDHLQWSWRLAGGTSPAWVALACAIGGLPSAPSAITFSATSDSPIRLSVQLRDATAGAGDRRWERTVFVDSERRSYSVPASALRPVASGPTAPGGEVRTLLFVVDWTHGQPGMHRAMRIERAAFVPTSDPQVRTVRSR